MDMPISKKSSKPEAGTKENGTPGKSSKSKKKLWRISSDPNFQSIREEVSSGKSSQVISNGYICVNYL